MQNAQTLLEKLSTLQCHFTWKLAFEDPVDVYLLLKCLTHQVAHTPYHNQSTYLAMKAFLYHLQKNYIEALKSLQEAEGLLKDNPSNFWCQFLVTYGNYAWIYYHLANYPKVEKYLNEIHGICQFLNSSQPYSVMTPEIQVQKGWSLLAAGFQNGEEATTCFQMALQEDQTNEEFKAGLATSFYASWEHFGMICNWDKSNELLEEIVPLQPQNWELKVYLASLHLNQDKERVKGLLEEVIQNSGNPEVLRKVAKLCMCVKPPLVALAISILKKATSLDDSYSLLYYDLGLCQKFQVEGVLPEDRAKVLVPVRDSFLWASNRGSLFIDPRLELAKLYGEREPAYEEQVYLQLMEELPNTSKRCQQAIYLHWGDFLLQKKGLKYKALEMYKMGLVISGGHFKERNQLRTRLMDLAKTFQEDSEVDCIAINSFLQTVECQDPAAEKGCPWWCSHRAWR